MYHSLIKVDEGHNVPYIYLFGVLYSNACMKQRFMTSTTCSKLDLTLTRTSSTLRSTTGVTIWDPCVRAGGGHLNTCYEHERSFIW